MIKGMLKEIFRVALLHRVLPERDLSLRRATGMVGYSEDTFKFKDFVSRYPNKFKVFPINKNPCVRNVRFIGSTKDVREAERFLKALERFRKHLGIPVEEVYPLAWLRYSEEED